MGKHTEGMDPPLLPCPFCGSADVEPAELCFHEPDGTPFSNHAVICDGCGALVEGVAWKAEGTGEPGFPTLAEAVAAWNLRGGKPGGRLDG